MNKTNVGEGHLDMEEVAKEYKRLGKIISDEANRARAQKYLDNIKNFGITRDQVESVDDLKQWFGADYIFNEWCDRNSRKRFRAWNGLVYLAGSSVNEALCTVDLLKERP